MVARSSASESENHYNLFRGCFIFIFPTWDFSTSLNRHFRNFAIRRGSGFNRSFTIGLLLKCLPKWRGKPKFCPFSSRTATHLAPLFFNGEENRKSKTMVSIIDYCRTRWHKFDEGRSTNIDKLPTFWSSLFFANYSGCSRNEIQLNFAACLDVSHISKFT